MRKRIKDVEDMRVALDAMLEWSVMRTCYAMPKSNRLWIVNMYYIYIRYHINLKSIVLYHITLYIYHGHEAKPSILGLQIVFLAARRDYGGGGDDFRARQEL